MSTHPTRRRLPAIAGAVAAACVLAACGGGGGGPAGLNTPTRSAVQPSGAHGGTPPHVRLQDPPQSFASEAVAHFDGNWFSPSVIQDVNDVLTVGDGAAYAYTYDDDGVGVAAYRLETGAIAWHATVPGADSAMSAPRPAAGIVVAAFRTRTAGTGTTQDSTGNTVAAFDAASGRTLWSREVTGNDDAKALPSVVGLDADHVLVAVAAPGYSDAPPTTVLLDAHSGQPLWTDHDLAGVDLEATAVVGMRQGGDFAGRSVPGGRVLWSRDLGLGDVQTDDPGPGMTLARGADGSLLLDPATGRTKTGTGDVTLEACDYDGQDTTVCSGLQDGPVAVVVAFDVRSGRELWRLPDAAAHREAPHVTAVRHGVLYGEAHDAMTLDARTGKDLRTGLGITPFLVTAGYGLVYDDVSRSVSVYKAAGDPAAPR